MRLIDKSEFLKMPEGTIFVFVGDPGKEDSLEDAMDNLNLKLQTCEDNGQGDAYRDFYFQNLTTLIGFDYSQQGNDNSDAFNRKAREGEKFRLDLDCHERDGRYLERDFFIVYEEEDVRKLISKLEYGLGKTTTQRT